MITSFRDHITEELIASVRRAEQNATVPRCGYTEVLAGTGEDAAPCGSLALYACDDHGHVCEFHGCLCVLGTCHVEEIGRVS